MPAACHLLPKPPALTITLHGALTAAKPLLGCDASRVVKPWPTEAPPHGPRQPTTSWLSPSCVRRPPHCYALLGWPPGHFADVKHHACTLKPIPHEASAFMPCAKASQPLLKMLKGPMLGSYRRLQGRLVSFPGDQRGLAS